MVGKERAYHVLECWKASEAAARAALSIKPDNNVALNLLASSLQNQGKNAASVKVAEALLADDPEDSYAHANLGWVKFHQGQYQEAAAHFREALRLEPGQEFARAGLIECFRARAFHYRLYLRWASSVGKVPDGMGWFLWIGVIVWFKIQTGQMKPLPPLVVGVALIVWLPVIFGRHLARGVSNGFILFDREVRICLTKEERMDGILVGGLVFSGLLAGILGLTVLSLPVAYGGLMLFAAAVPTAYSVLNTRKAGRFLFGAIALIAAAGGLLQFFNAALMAKSDVPGWVFVSLLACALSPWMGNSSKLVKRP